MESPDQYEKESWQLNDTERFKVISESREVGNELYRNGKIGEAEEKYRAALEIIEQLLLKYVSFHVSKMKKSKKVFLEPH